MSHLRSMLQFSLLLAVLSYFLANQHPFYNTVVGIRMIQLGGVLMLIGIASGFFLVAHWGYRSLWQSTGEQSVAGNRILAVAALFVLMWLTFWCVMVVGYLSGFSDRQY